VVEWLFAGSAARSVSAVDAARTGKTAMERVAGRVVPVQIDHRHLANAARTGETAMEGIAGPVMSGQVSRRHRADPARSGEAAMKWVRAVYPAVGVTDEPRLAPGAHTEDRNGDDGEDGDLTDAQTRCGPRARGRCGDLGCHGRAP
jgi:hypothetical protein